MSSGTGLRVLLVDDSQYNGSLMGLGNQLENEIGLCESVIRETDLAGALMQVGDYDYDVVIIGFKAYGQMGERGLKKIRLASKLPDTKIILYKERDDSGVPDDNVGALYGRDIVDSYVAGIGDRSRMVGAVRNTAAGEKVFLTQPT